MPEPIFNGMPLRSYSLTREDAQEVLHKMSVLADTPDLYEDYELTHTEAEALRDSVPQNGGTWDVPLMALKCVCEEMQDHVVVLRDIASDAHRNREAGQALRINKQAKRFEEMFQP